MNSEYLITGSQGPFMTLLVKHLLARGNNVWAPPGKPELLITPPKGKEENFHPLKVLPRTPLAARALMLDFINSKRRLDHHIHLFHPDVQGKSLAEISGAVIEQNLDTNIKGMIFPIRESLKFLLEQGTGGLSLVVLGGINTIFPPLQSVGFGAIQELGRSLFALYQNEDLALRGFHAPADIDQNLFTEFIGSALSEDSPKTRGRWNKFSGKSGFFGLR